MSKTKRILLKIYYEVAKGKRKCRRDKKHSILKGDKCLVVEDYGSKSYCLKCAPVLLKKAQADIVKLQEQL